MEIALANKDIERIVLGVSLNNPQAYYRVADTVTEDCFTTPFYGKVWGIMHGIMTGGETPDLMAVANALRMDGGTEGIAELAEIHADAGLSYQGADQYLIDLRDRRNVYLAVTEAQRRLTDPTYSTDEIMQTLSQSVGKVAEAADRGIASLRDVFSDIQSKAFDRMGSGEEAGFNTGFVQIDRLGGLVKSDLTISPSIRQSTATRWRSIRWRCQSPNARHVCCQCVPGLTDGECFARRSPTRNIRRWRTA